MRNIKLTIEYDGTLFRGWQIQAKKERTVQGEFEKALNKIFKSKIRPIGSGRTDSGVHARGQVAHFKTTSTMPAHEILSALNGNIGYDVRVLSAIDVPLDFHAQYNAKRKTYRYVILNREINSAIDRKFCLHLPQKINLTSMQKEGQALLGKKDFASFQASNSDQKKKENNTVRTISALDIKKKRDFIYIDIEANGFLYKMVRNIVGTLLEIGTGERPIGSIRQILKKKNRIYAGDTAPPHGLFLMNVVY